MGIDSIEPRGPDVRELAVRDAVHDEADHPDDVARLHRPDDEFRRELSIAAVGFRSAQRRIPV
jgi:hypothetical protein